MNDYNAQIIGVNRHMKRFFDENGFNYSPNDVEFDKESWENYLDEYIKNKAVRDKKYGGKSDFEVWLLTRIVKFMSCFIVDRHRRVAFRVEIKKKWGIT